MKYKVILFDADETLFDFKKSEKEAFKNTMIEFGFDYDENYHFSIYKEINTVIWKELEENLITHAELKIERFKRLKDKLGVNFDENEFADAYIKHLGNGSFLLDGAAKLVEELSHKYTLSIITNGLTSVQERRIKKSAISKYFKDLDIGNSHIKSSFPQIDFDKIHTIFSSGSLYNFSINSCSLCVLQSPSA